MTRLPERNLDILRAMAVVVVVVAHGASFAARRTAATDWMGQAGVLAFFVHTALVLMASLERDGAVPGTRWAWRFYVRRVCRIYPLAWVTIAMVVLWRIPSGGPTTTFAPIPLSSLLANAALVQNLTSADSVLLPLWSLPLEIQMYALLPLCFLIARRPDWRGMTGLAVASVLLDAIYLVWHRSPALARLSLLQWLPCFVSGVLAYWMLRRTSPEPTVGRSRASWPAWTWPAVVIVATALAGIGWIHGLYWLVRAAYCAALALALPQIADAAPSRLARGAHTIATYSYGIYLFHMFGLRVGFVVLVHQSVLVQWVAALTTITGLSVAGHYLVERPGIALGARLARSIGRTPSAPPSGNGTMALSSACVP